MTEIRPCHAVQIAENIWWVGAIDWSLRDFHGYSTPRGTTYNSYLLIGEDRKILIDTVKAPYFDEMMHRISSVIDPSEIDIIVSNHSEMDHTGSLVRTVEAIKPERVLASAMGKKHIAAQLGWDGAEVVKSGDTLDAGGMTLHFMETRMLHWPDSMVTWVPERRVLFSQDITGLHLATRALWADENPSDIVRYELAKYYANIVMPYSALVLRFLDQAEAAGITPEVVANDHGPIFRGDYVAKVLTWYREWALKKPTRRVVIPYATMWGSTEKMARAAAEGVANAGCEPKVMALANGITHRSDVAERVLEAGGLMVGTPTLNNHMFPVIADVLMYLKGLKPRNMVGAAFGSYGWSGEGVPHVGEFLEGMGVEVVDTLNVRFVPGEEDLAAAYELGYRVGQRIQELIGS